MKFLEKFNNLKLKKSSLFFFNKKKKTLSDYKVREREKENHIILT